MIVINLVKIPSGFIPAHQNRNEPANVLKKENDTTADNLIFSIFEMMDRRKRSKKKIAGLMRKTHGKPGIEIRNVTFKLGGIGEEELFNFNSGDTGGMSYE